jgi:hypothetical protein
VLVTSNNDQIGGTAPGEGNVIAFNQVAGLEVASGDQIEGNSIYQNQGPGLELVFALASGNQIEANSIYQNQGPAIEVGGTGDRIEGNSIYGNLDNGFTGQPIDNLDQGLYPSLNNFFELNYPGGPLQPTGNESFGNTLSLIQNDSTSMLTYSGTLMGGLPDTRYLLALDANSINGGYWGSYFLYVTTDSNGVATFATPPFQAPWDTSTDTPAAPSASAYVAHSLGNYQQNYPVLAAATSGSSSVVSGTLNGQPKTTFTVDVYASRTVSPSDYYQGQYYGQGQYHLGYATVTTDVNGNASFSADFSAANLPCGILPAGWYISVTATDPGGNTSQFSADVTSAPATQSFSQYLQAALPQNSTAPAVISIEAGPDQTPATVLPAVNGLMNVTQPVKIIYDLGGGTYTGGVAADPPANVALVVQNGTLTKSGGAPALPITGGNVTTISLNLDPNVSAVTVAGGQVAILDSTLTTSGNAPTLLVTGGSVTLLNDDVVQASPTGAEPAIAVTGGTLNLGTAASPGNNTLSVNSSGDLVSNTTGNPISAVGDTFVVGGTVETAPSLSFTRLASSAPSAIRGQPVTLTATVVPDMPGSATPTGTIDFYDTTTNTDLGKVTPSGGVASLTTSAFALGTNVIQASYGGNTSYLPSLAFVTQQVDYHFSGFLAPLNSNLAMALNRTVPIKFQLTDYQGNSVGSLSAVTSLLVLSAQGTDILAGAGSTGLRVVGNQFIYNWQTKSLSE